MPSNKNSEKDQKKVAPIIHKKVVANKCNATSLLDVVLTPDQAVGEYLRLFLSNPNGVPSELLIHHPVGITDLDDVDWVFSSPENLRRLVQRAKDPKAQYLQEKRTAYIHEAAIKDGKLTVKDDELAYPNGKPRSSYLSDLKKTEKFKHKDDKKYKFVISAALDADKSVESGFEQAYRKFASKLTPEAEGKFPTTYRTLGGTFMDQPQKRVKHLSGMTLTQVQAHVFKHGVNEPDTSIAKPASEATPPDVSETLAGGNPDQKFFIPPTVKQADRRNAKKAAKGLRDFLDTHNMSEYVIVVATREDQDN